MRRPRLHCLTSVVRLDVDLCGARHLGATLAGASGRTVRLPGSNASPDCAWFVAAFTYCVRCVRNAFRRPVAFVILLRSLPAWRLLPFYLPPTLHYLLTRLLLHTFISRPETFITTALFFAHCVTMPAGARGSRCAVPAVCRAFYATVLSSLPSWLDWLPSTSRCLRLQGFLLVQHKPPRRLLPAYRRLLARGRRPMISRRRF